MQACASCISAKARCDNSKPCTRCRLRGLECRVSNHHNGRRSHDKHPETDSGITAKMINAESPRRSMSSPQGTGSAAQFSASTPASLSPATEGQLQITETALPSPDLTIVPTTDKSDNTIQDAVQFPCISTNGVDAFQQSLFPNFFQLDHNFSTDFDFDFSSIDVGSNDFFAMVDSPASNIQLTDWPSTTSRHFQTFGHEAFRKSPWLWSPGEKDSAYAENDALNMGDSGASTIPELERVSSANQVQVKPLTVGIRDQLLAMVLETCEGSPRLIRSFPSVKILNGLFQIYFYKTGMQVDNWVHAPSLDPSRCPIQLVAAIVGAGAQFVAEKAIWSMGLALLESVRLSLSKLIDKDNTWTRNLHAVQTYRMWTDYGLWSGFKRKMEIAESFGNIPMTMQRRAGAFRSSYYVAHEAVVSVVDKTPEMIENIWSTWVRSESMKR